MGTRLPTPVRRRITRRAVQKTDVTWATYLNTFLTTLISIGMLTMAYAQWRATEKQADIADTLGRLEIAKSQAQFQISTSRQSINLSNGDAAFSLPKFISIKTVAGVQTMDELDGHGFLTIEDLDGGYLCTVEVRGLYIENEAGVLTLFEEPVQSLQTFLQQLRTYKFLARGEAHLSVRYHDLFGERHSERFRARDGFNLSRNWMDSVEAPAVLYSGAWSNGQGLYFEGLPKVCGNAASALQDAAVATGGRSGSD